jgi:hypothetical protein
MKAMRLLLVLGVVSLAGCAAPTRTSDPSAFTLLQRGEVESSKVQAFLGCLTDGFTDAHPFLATLSTRQQRRSTGYRIETVSEGVANVSANVGDDGQVAIFESRTAVLINTSGERQAFARCLDQYGKRAG